MIVKWFSLKRLAPLKSAGLIHGMLRRVTVRVHMVKDSPNFYLELNAGAGKRQHDRPFSGYCGYSGAAVPAGEK
jgi:hypothetical protein